MDAGEYRDKYTAPFPAPAQPGPAKVAPLDDRHYLCGSETGQLENLLPLANLTVRELRRALLEAGFPYPWDYASMAGLKAWIAEKDARIAALEESLSARQALLAEREETLLRQQALLLAGKSGRNSLANLRAIALARSRGLASGLAGRGARLITRRGPGDKGDDNG